MKMMACIVLMLSLEVTLLDAGRPSDDVGSIFLASQGEVAGADEVQAGAAVIMGGRRPWKCCDQPICRGSTYIVCECADEVEECADECNACVPSKGNASRNVCEDVYIGKPGPVCTERPWKCCDHVFYLDSACQCADEVEQCAANCKLCLCVPAPLHPLSRRIMCFDLFQGSPGPECEYLVAGGGGVN